jgi:hypothetical protein
LDLHIPEVPQARSGSGTNDKPEQTRKIQAPEIDAQVVAALRVEFAQLRQYFYFVLVKRVNSLPF